MIPVQISEDAQADLNEGFLFYERKSRGWVITLPLADSYRREADC